MRLILIPFLLLACMAWGQIDSPNWKHATWTKATKSPGWHMQTAWLSYEGDTVWLDVHGVTQFDLDYKCGDRYVHYSKRGELDSVWSYNDGLTRAYRKAVSRVAKPAPADFYWHVKLDTFKGNRGRNGNYVINDVWTEWYLYVTVTDADTTRTFRVCRIEPTEMEAR